MNILFQSTIPILCVILIWTWRCESRLSRVEKSLKHLCQEMVKWQRLAGACKDDDSDAER
ncbi:MAG: hypothetical protein Q7J98_10235 [Kiritimatiellia bacterium]|nr:hypothetical protein [Kiritimatiellia bacterium]